jgi:hypothetical protein
MTCFVGEVIRGQMFLRSCLPKMGGMGPATVDMYFLSTSYSGTLHGVVLEIDEEAEEEEVWCAHCSSCLIARCFCHSVVVFLDL